MEDATPAPPTPEHVRGLTWWQAVLVYPALASAVLGAIPTAWQAFKAWRLDVAYTQVQIAAAQRQLWERNLGCLDLRPVYSVEGPGGVVIGVTICPGGDVLLRYDVGEEVTYTWIAYPHALAPQSQRVSGVAWAQEPASPWRAQLLYGASRCVRVQGGVVVRLHTTDGQTCLLEHIHLGSGRVVTQVVVPCTTPCPVLHSWAPSSSSPSPGPSPSGRSNMPAARSP